MVARATQAVNEFGLTAAQHAQIAGVLGEYPGITAVRVFGSRAKGTHRATSDLDLALSGTLDWRDVARIAGEFDDLDLPFRVDVLQYEALTHEALRAHIDRVGRPFHR